MQKYLAQLIKNKELTTVMLGLVAFSFILALSLNLTLAFLVLVIFIDLAIFQKSFHLGWIFSLFIITTFPTVYLADNLATLTEVITLVLALIGLINFLLDKQRIKIFPLFYYWSALVVWAVAVSALKGEFALGKEINQVTFYQLVTVFSVYPLIIVSLQYFFQTLRRLERFFLTISLIGVWQSFFGLMAMIFGWKFSNGIGFSKEIFGNVFSGKINGQITGFLGSNLFLQLGDNALAMLLLVTIPVTFGLWLLQREGLSTLSLTLRFPILEEGGLNKIVDSIFNDNSGGNDKVVDLKKVERQRIGRQWVFMLFLILQIGVLVLTFSYNSLIVLGVGILVIGILLRNDGIIGTVLVLLLVFVIILPGLEPSLVTESKKHLLDIWYALKDNFSWQLLWRGAGGLSKDEGYNSYLIIFNKVGLLGLLIFLGGLRQYFAEIRRAYLKSDGFERVWLIVILAIFVEFVILGLFNNLFFVGPGALLFWLLYGVLQNLKYNQVEFRLTETRIKDLNIE
jgi:hypothetical protein